MSITTKLKIAAIILAVLLIAAVVILLVTPARIQGDLVPGCHFGGCDSAVLTAEAPPAWWPFGH